VAAKRAATRRLGAAAGSNTHQPDGLHILIAEVLVCPISP
jgi:hypothetical protein